MNKRMLLLFGILLVIANACGVPGTEIQTNKTPGLAATEVTASEIAPPQSTTPKIPTKEGLYENDIFSFTIPEGWGLTLSQGEHFDLGVKKIITIHNKSLSKNSVAFFTIASVALSDEESLKSRFDQAYKKGPELENAVIDPFEKNSMTGIELTYGRPWGEPRYIFHDIWLEKDGVVYVLSFQAYPDSFEPYTPTFASILDSFSFKQSQTKATKIPEAKATEIPEAKATDFPLPPPTARIAFTATGWTVPGSGEEIFVMNTDGSGVTALSNNRGDDRDPARFA